MADFAHPSFICPITQSVMSDPVCDREGNTYERAAIEAWVAARGTSPITRTPLTLADLFPNRSLRTAIEDYLSTLTAEQIARIRPDAADAIAAARGREAAAADGGVGGLASPASPSLPALGLEMTACRDTTSDALAGGSTLILTTIASPEEVERIASDIVVVIDVSGSMGSEASVSGAEQSQLSLLDITKHAVKTIINTMEEHDRLSIVSFSDNAQVVCGLTVMNAAGRARATELINGLRDGGSTNLWDGLVKGLDLLKHRSADTVGGISGVVRNAAVMLLTDGQPSIEPPRGHIPMLRRWRDQNDGKFPALISTFGFGYNLDSKLLAEIAIEGGGMYSFIPDAGFVGTAFVHALANTLTTVARDVTLKLEPEDGGSPRSLMGYAAETNGYAVSWGYEVSVGSVRAGQPIQALVRLGPGSSAPTGMMHATLGYQPANTTTLNNLGVDGPAGGPTEANAEIAAQGFRLDFVQHVTAAYTMGAEICRAGGTLQHDERFLRCQERLTQLSTDIKTWLASPASLPAAGGARDGPGASPKDRVTALLTDLDGQVKEALSRQEYFNKWGKHYLPSLVRGHQLQACNNFKDPGQQFYGGRLFRSIRDQADDIFSEMPAPTPSLSYTSRSGYTAWVPPGAATGAPRAAPAPPAPVSMSMYNSRNTPCVHGQSMVDMADGSVKAAQNIVAGDLLSTGRVLCVLKTVCPSGYTDLVQLPGGLRITPWHPVCMSATTAAAAAAAAAPATKAWQFPCQVAGATQVQRMPCDAVYSFLAIKTASDQPQPQPQPQDQESGAALAYAESLTVDGCSVIALAHGIVDDAVATHQLFGTTRIAEELAKCQGWRHGLVTFLPGCVEKSPETGLATGLDLSMQVVVPAEKEQVLGALAGSCFQQPLVEVVAM